jgi:hypothetical protein
MSRILISALNEEQVLFPPTDPSCLPLVPDSPFHRLVGLSRTEMSDSRGLDAADRRLLTQHFVTTFQWSAIRPLLPLRLIVPPGVPPWQPRRCRSHYLWLPPEDILSADDLDGLEDFDLILRIFDLRVKSRISCKKGGMSQAASPCVLRSTALCVPSGNRPSWRRRSLSC